MKSDGGEDFHRFHLAICNSELSKVDEFDVFKMFEKMRRCTGMNTEIAHLPFPNQRKVFFNETFVIVYCYLPPAEFLNDFSVGEMNAIRYKFLHGFLLAHLLNL